MKELLPRERFIRTLRHEPVDRISTLYRMKSEAKQKIARVFGIENAATGRKHDPSLELRLGNDAIIYQIGINADFSHRHIDIGETWYNLAKMLEDSSRKLKFRAKPAGTAIAVEMQAVAPQE